LKAATQERNSGFETAPATGACGWLVGHWLFACFVSAAFVLAISSGFPASAQSPANPKRVTIDILVEKPVVEPGSEIWIALRERIEPGWHTYWTNPGDSGEPTTVAWKLPPGFEAGPLQFPLPSTIPVGPLVNYGYSGEVLLLSRLQVPRDAKPGRAELKASAEWLVCKDICIPESGEAQITLEVTTAGMITQAGPHAAQLAAAAAALPVKASWPVRFAVAPESIDLTFVGFGTGGKRPDTVTFFPETWGHIQHAAPQTATWTGDDLTLRLMRGDLKKEALTGLTGVLAIEGAPGAVPARRGFSVLAGAPAPKAAATSQISNPPSLAVPTAAPIGLVQALLFAVLGGLILNLMPCVFPVLSLKAVALAQTGRLPAERQTDGLAYLAGVLVSFAVLALALLGLRQAGQSLGWGFQFQSPLFVLVMAGLFFLLGLTLSGILSFGESLTGTGDKLARQAGPAGAFFTGALATIAATPCTAPFMGAALGYALGASALAGFAVLMAMGLGFAAPVVALSISPALQRLMPRPGRWMETFKQAMAFPLYASAAWMVWVLSLQAGSEGVLAAMVLLVGLGFLAWLWTRMQTSGRAGYAAALLLAGALLTGAAAGLIDPASEAKPGAANVQGSALQTDVTGLPIIPFSKERIAALQQEGRPVLVNLTAAWCITCKVNEKVALSSERMRTAFTNAKIAYVKGDWTRQDPEITRFLQAFGRAGVPLYLLYPGKPGAPPRVLDQVLTEGHVLAELQAITAMR
jgi:thiol:disulfide interchange protein/DsbC/DsbD-like thiol-disulfide interchange protein